MAFVRWLAPVALAVMTAACHAVPAPAPMAVPADERQLVAAGKPPAYEKIFPAPVKPPQFPVAVIAHRGYSKVAPENTLAAFRAALAADADIIELDVHMTRDDHLVVMHDGSVERTTNGEGDIADFTLAEIKALDAGGWFSPEFAG